MQIEDALVGFMSVYALNDVSARSVMWHEIVDALLVVDSWIVGGYFSNVEST